MEGSKGTRQKWEQEENETFDQPGQRSTSIDIPPPLAPVASDRDGQGTLGIELEFLCVICRRKHPTDDPARPEPIVIQHPDETRWLSTKMTELEQKMSEEDLKYRSRSYFDSPPEFTYKRERYTRSKMTRVLRDAGLTVIKWPCSNINYGEEDMGTVPINDFSESDGSDDELEENYTNGSVLADFATTLTYNPALHIETNVREAANKLAADYANFMAARRLKPYRTRREDLKDIAERLNLVGWPIRTLDDRENLFNHLLGPLDEDRLRNKQHREDQRNSAVDPLHVPVPGIRPQYQAWTVTNDPSVDGNGMTIDRYNMFLAQPTPDPMGDYRWFGAEVVSPVLPQGDARTREVIRLACRTIRNTFRIHKPMEVSTGLHVHLGHTRGWSLQQLKRFSSLWFLAEDSIYSMQRRDRGLDRKWCGRIRDQSRLWKALFSEDPVERSSLQSAMGAMQYNEMRAPQLYDQFVAEYDAHIPRLSITDTEINFLQHLWQVRNINEINFCLGETRSCRTGLRWRVTGGNQTGDNDNPLVASNFTQTIEVRIMAGTLDAEHINAWTIFLEHIVNTVRNLADDDFRAVLEVLVRDRSRRNLFVALRLPDDVAEYWLAPKRRDDMDAWYQYPDRDRVMWGFPFMSRGHRHTHGDLWDD